MRNPAMPEKNYKGGWSDAAVNRAIEDVFLRLRAAKQVEKCVGEGLPLKGAIAIFPVAVFAPGQNTVKSLRPYPLRLSHEPGTVLLVGEHAITATAEIREFKLEGKFFIVVGGVKKQPPKSHWRLLDSSGNEVEIDWVQDLPESFWVPSRMRKDLRLESRRMINESKYAYEELYNLSVPTMKAALAKYQSAIFHQSSSLDLNDVLQECWIRHLQRIDSYASPNRPNATWRQVLVVNTKRDGGREIRRNQHKISDQVSQLVGIIRNNQNVKTPVELQKFVTISREVAARLKQAPEASPTKVTKQVSREWTQGVLEPKISLKVAESAFLAAPFENSISLSAPVSHESDMSYDDFLPDTKEDGMGSERYETKSQEENLHDIIRFLFPNNTEQFLLEIGLAPPGYQYKNSDKITSSEMRRLILRKFKLRNEVWDTEIIRARVVQVLFDENGDIRPIEEVKDWINNKKEVVTRQAQKARREQ